jgi:hypothetical protein
MSGFPSKASRKRSSSPAWSGSVGSKRPALVCTFFLDATGPAADLLLVGDNQTNSTPCPPVSSSIQLP